MKKDAPTEKKELTAVEKQRGVIKLVVCSEATKDCDECVCHKPHERHFITEEDNKPCTKWNYCHYKGRKVRCTKVL